MLLRMQFQEDTLRRFPDTPIHGMDKAFSELLGLNPKYFGHIKNGRRNVGNKLSRHIESQFRLPIGFMDAAHSESAGATDPERQFTLSALELYRVDPAGALAVVMRALGDALARKQSPGKAP